MHLSLLAFYSGMVSLLMLFLGGSVFKLKWDVQIYSLSGKELDKRIDTTLMPLICTCEACVT